MSSTFQGARLLTNKSTNFYRKLFVIASVLLIFVALLIRFLLIRVDMAWISDISHSQLISRLILHNKGSPQFGHWNSGLESNYPPYFYHTIAFLRTVSDTYYWVLGVQALLSLAAGLAVYKITTLIGSRKFGIFALLLYLVSPPMAEVSSSVWQPCFAVPIALLSFIAVAQACLNKRISLFRLTLSIVVLAFSTTIAYGATLQVLLVIILFLLFLPKIKLKLFYAPFTLIAFCIFNVQPIITNGVGNYILMHIRALGYGKPQINPLNTYNNFNLVLHSTFNEFVPVATFIFLVMALLVYLWQEKSRRKKVFITVLSIYYFASLYLSARVGQIHYGLVQYPILYILLGASLSKFFRKGSVVLGTAGVFLIIYFTVAFFPKNLNKLFKSEVGSRNYILFNDLTKSILYNVGNRSKTLFLVVENGKDGKGYSDSTNFWYFHSYENLDAYVLEPSDTFCPVNIGGICYKDIPGNIVLVCPRIDSKISKMFRNRHIEYEDCLGEYSKIAGTVGKRVDKKSQIGEINFIAVDEFKYKKMKFPIIQGL